MVRSSVGVADVSTLGKIDIQGPDAARFLDFVYTNTFSTLPVGLRPVTKTEIGAGAHLFNTGDKVERVNDQGYVTSVCGSPVFESYLGLAFLKDGRARHGQRVRLVDHMRKTDVLCEVTDPVFLDPEGAKLRA